MCCAVACVGVVVCLVGACLAVVCLWVVCFVVVCVGAVVCLAVGFVRAVVVFFAGFVGVVEWVGAARRVELGKRWARPNPEMATMAPSEMSERACSAEATTLSMRILARG